MYILFEGIDTCGKTTQIELLKEKHPSIVTTKEPGGTKFGISARAILLDNSLTSKYAELLLFLADRAEHYEEVIQKNHKSLIVSDRGFLSGISYALANGDFDFDTLMQLNKFALQNHLPDKIILFLTNIKTLKKRTSLKKLDGIELRGLEYLMSVQKHMEESLTKLDIDYLLIDADSDIEVIHKQIIDFIQYKPTKELI